MKKILFKKNRPFFYLLFSSLIFINFLSGSSYPFGKKADQEWNVQFSYRELSPGEVILISLEDSPLIRNVYVRVFGKKYNLSRPMYSHKILGFIGLDLNIKPGRILFEIYINRMDGHSDMIRKILIVSKKIFKTKKLWVKEKYVTPPLDVQQRIQRESSRLKGVFGKYSAQWLGNGSFILPVEGKRVLNFGERRIFNNKPRSPHSGEDISALQGAKVAASNSGKIVLVSNLYFSGKTVIIDHGLGVYSTYCHLSSFHVKQGQSIEKGMIIGEVGATGRVTGPHLHWSIKVSGNRIDPYSLLFLSL